MRYLTEIVEENGMVSLEIFHHRNVRRGAPSALVAYATRDDETVLELLSVLTRLAAPIKRAKQQNAKATGNVVVGRFGLGNKGHIVSGKLKDVAVLHVPSETTGGHAAVDDHETPRRSLKTARNKPKAMITALAVERSEASK